MFILPAGTGKLLIPNSGVNPDFVGTLPLSYTGMATKADKVKNTREKSSFLVLGLYYACWNGKAAHLKSRR